MEEAIDNPKAIMLNSLHFPYLKPLERTTKVKQNKKEEKERKRKETKGGSNLM